MNHSVEVPNFPELDFGQIRKEGQDRKRRHKSIKKRKEGTWVGGAGRIGREESEGRGLGRTALFANSVWDVFCLVFSQPACPGGERSAPGGGRGTRIGRGYRDHPGTNPTKVVLKPSL